MGEATGTLDVITPQGLKRYQWNGNPADKAVAKEAFEKAMGQGFFLAFVTETPGRARQVRRFSEIEEMERQQGTVAAQISPAIQGG